MVLCFIRLQHRKLAKHNTTNLHCCLVEHLLSFVRYSSCGQSSWTLSSWTVLFDDDINRYVEKKIFWKNSYCKWFTSFNHLMKIYCTIQALMVFRAFCFHVHGKIGFYKVKRYQFQIKNNFLWFYGILKIFVNIIYV